MPGSPPGTPPAARAAPASSPTHPGPETPIRLVLVRHGETDFNREDRWQGSRSDEPLNETGRAQIRSVAERLVAVSGELAALYTSDLVRALESAEILGRRLGLSPRVEPGLREMDHGAFEGLTKAEAMALFPEVHAALEADPARVQRPEGDSYDSLGERLWPTLGRIVDRHAGERVAIVAHGGPIRLVLSRALDRPLTERAAFGVTNGSWFVVEVAGDRWRVAAAP